MILRDAKRVNKVAKGWTLELTRLCEKVEMIDVESYRLMLNEPQLCYGSDYAFPWMYYSLTPGFLLGKVYEQFNCHQPRLYR